MPFWAICLKPPWILNPASSSRSSASPLLLCVYSKNLLNALRVQIAASLTQPAIVKWMREFWRCEKDTQTNSPIRRRFPGSWMWQWRLSSCCGWMKHHAACLKERQSERWSSPSLRLHRKVLSASRVFVPEMWNVIREFSTLSSSTVKCQRAKPRRGSISLCVIDFPFGTRYCPVYSNYLLAVIQYERERSTRVRIVTPRMHCCTAMYSKKTENACCLSKTLQEPFFWTFLCVFYACWLCSFSGLLRSRLNNARLRFDVEQKARLLQVQLLRRPPSVSPSLRFQEDWFAVGGERAVLNQRPHQTGQDGFSLPNRIGVGCCLRDFVPPSVLLEDKHTLVSQLCRDERRR